MTTTHAIDSVLPQLEAQVLSALQAQNIDSISEVSQAAHLVQTEVKRFHDQCLSLGEMGLVDPQATAKKLIDKFCGLGPLEIFLNDPTIEEIWIDDPSHVFISKDGKTSLTTLMLNEEQVQNLVERMLRASGRRLDMSSPFVDASLSDGSRLHVVIPPVTGRHWAVNIRRHILRSRHLTDLVAAGSIPAGAARFLQAAVASGLNLLVSGATQSGKTTLLRSLAGAIPANERIITCEEVFELELQARDVVALQTRPANLEGKGEITLRRLVKEALRMRPERLIIGEVREAEALDLLIALNAGLPGACTLHANSAREALRKLTILPLLAGENVSSDFVLPTVAGAIDLVVHLRKDRDGKRRVIEILAVTGRVEGGHIETSCLWESTNGQLRRSNGTCAESERFTQAGFDLEQLLSEGV